MHDLQRARWRQGRRRGERGRLAAPLGPHSLHSLPAARSPQMLVHQLLQPEAAATPLGGVLPCAVRAAKPARSGRALLWVRLLLLSLRAPRNLSCCLLLLWLQQAVARRGGVHLEHEPASSRRDDVATHLRHRGDGIFHPARKRSRGRGWHVGSRHSCHSVSAADLSSASRRACYWRGTTVGQSQYIRCPPNPFPAHPHRPQPACLGSVTPSLFLPPPLLWGSDSLDHRR